MVSSKLTLDLDKTLKIRPETHRKLSKLGLFGESFDDVINRLIEFYEKNKK